MKMPFKLKVFCSCATMLAAFSLASNRVFGQLPSGYWGDDTCKVCHVSQFNDYVLSGHPYKLNHTGGLAPGDAGFPTWPHTAPPPLPPDGLQWSGVEYVIGNFFWKARFVQSDGYIHTGDQVQYNLATGDWVAYHSGEVHSYNCQRCHCTGGDNTAGTGTHQGGLPGIDGTWVFDGVRCEACHSPGGPHDGDISDVKDCSDCHYRDAQFRMPWKGGFGRHHQQGEDHSHSPHKEMHCDACHDPHKSTVYGLGGLVKECTDCHPGTAANNHYKAPFGMDILDCKSCHMPYMNKSAVAFSDLRADVHTHLFQIMTEPTTKNQNVTADGFWSQDANGDAFITLDFACKRCHNNLTMNELAAFAAGIHGPQAPACDVKVVGPNVLDPNTPPDGPVLVDENTPVSVEFSLSPGGYDGTPADWTVSVETLFGWYTYIPGAGWQPGTGSPSLSNTALSQLNSLPLYVGPLPLGFFDFYFDVDLSPGGPGPQDTGDNVPVYVFPVLP